MGNEISQKIDAYAKANLQSLKKEEAKTGRKMTKFDIAQYMLQHGKLNKNEYANWMNTQEGFNAQTLSKQQAQALRQGNVWGFAGYGGGQESYLDSLTSFSQKTPVEKQNAISHHQMKLNETVAERKKKAAEINNHIKNERILNAEKTAKEQKLVNHLNSLPEVDATYTELMNDIKFQDMNKSEKIEHLLKTTGQKFYEAKERGDKAAMKEYLLQGFSYAFAYMDDKSGITDIKDAVKKYSGLNALVDTVDKLVDDGDDSNLSFTEKAWNTVKGAGDAVDSMIGTQGIAIVGALAAAAEAAAAAGIGTAFSVATQAIFGYEGATMVVEGAEQVYNAETAEEAREGGAKLGVGGMMLYGSVKSAKEGYNNYKMEKSAQQELSNARKTLGLDDGIELTEGVIKNAKKSLALKNHPDRGGSVETMQEINNAANLLLKSLNTGSARAAVTPGKPAQTSPTSNTPTVKTSPSPKTASTAAVSTEKISELAKAGNEKQISSRHTKDDYEEVTLKEYRNSDGALTTREHVKKNDTGTVTSTTHYDPKTETPIVTEIKDGMYKTEIITYDKNGNIISSQKTITPKNEDYGTKKTTTSYEYDKDGLIVKKDIKNDYENLNNTKDKEYDIRDLTEKTEYGTHRKQIKLINGHKVGIEEIPNQDGSTTVKLIDKNGQCVTRKISPKHKYSINTKENEVFIYEEEKGSSLLTIMYVKNQSKVNFCQERNYSVQDIPSDNLKVKTTQDQNFFDE